MLGLVDLEILLGKYPSGNIDSPGKFVSLPKPPPAGLPSDLLHRRLIYTKLRPHH